jgi:hypothetical protein
MFNPRPLVDLLPIAPGHHAYVIDNALADPQRWVELAAQHRSQFESSSHNAYPGIELRMPDALSERLGEFFALHVRGRLGARRTQRQYSRLSLALKQPDELEPRQWICHRDQLEPEAGKLTAACVLYLFRDASLGGTGFFVPRRAVSETRLLIHESGTLSREKFTDEYGIAAGYQTESNAWFEKTAAIEPRWNRLVFYDGGAVFHCSDIRNPTKLSDDPRTGRLTLNGFFVCRTSAA